MHAEQAAQDLLTACSGQGWCQVESGMNTACRTCHAQVEYDLFEVMAERGLHYGYTEMSSESPAVSKGMWSFVQDYVHTHFIGDEQARLERNEVRLMGA